MPLTDNLRGALLMTASMAGFGFNDAAMKAVLAEMPLMPAIALRGLLMAMALAAICWATGAFRWRPSRRDAGLIGWRAVGEIGGTVAFLTALSHMPIAAATAILQSTPLAVTLAALLFLGEPVGWRRGVALALGFAGVLLIVRPGGETFSWYAVSALAAVGFIVLRDLVTRGLSAAVPSPVVSLATCLALTTVAGIASLAEPLPEIRAEMLARIALAASFLVVGYLAGVRTMRVGEVGFIAPFRYTILLFALITGLVFFGEVPDPLTLAGAALVVGTGMFTFWRERRLAAAGR